MRKYLILLGLLCLVSEDKIVSNLYVGVDRLHYEKDIKKKLVVSHLKNIERFENIAHYSDVVLYLGSTKVHFLKKPERLTFESSYEVYMNNEVWTLYFTSLPIISVQSKNYIIDEPKASAVLNYADYEKELISHIGIENRGGSSLVYLKKTYDIEFWSSPSGELSKNVALGSLRKDDDWILDALYNEPLRLRSNLAHTLWLELNQLDNKTKFRGIAPGARVKYVEVFVKGLYCGVYNLSEQIDRKQLGLKKYSKSSNDHGELYQGADHGDANRFISVSDYDNTLRRWSGFELKYPKEQEDTDWQNLHEFVNFAINSSDEEFVSEVCDRFQCDNLIDYFIFLNFLKATDNLGKNIYVARHGKEQPYFYIPWDLDGVLGTTANGENLHTTDIILSNEFMSRMRKLSPNRHNARLTARWRALRKDVLSNESILERIQELYNFLEKNRIYERERKVHPNYDFDQKSLDYIIDWTLRRLEYLDGYYESIKNS